MSKIIDEYVNNNQIKSSNFLLKVRLWFYSLIYCLMIVIAYILLQIDFTASKDPLVRLYHHNRWLLLTSLFNLISLVYTPICIYCDWRELHRTDDAKHVRILNKIRFVCFSSILFPTTTFSDILFWKLWIKDRDLVAPAAVHVLCPLWLQHFLHTVTLVVIILDLLLVPRRRPKNLMLAVLVLSTYLGAYYIICGRSIINNEHVYPLLRLFSGYRLIPLAVFVGVEHFFYFTIQWLIVDLVWGRNTQTHALLSLLFCRRRELLESTKNPTTERKSRKDTIRIQKYTKKVKAM